MSVTNIFSSYQFHRSVMTPAECSSPRHQIRRGRTAKRQKKEREKKVSSRQRFIIPLLKRRRRTFIISYDGAKIITTWRAANAFDKSSYIILFLLLPQDDSSVLLLHLPSTGSINPEKKGSILTCRPYSQPIVDPQLFRRPSISRRYCTQLPFVAPVLLPTKSQQNRSKMLNNK